VGIVPNPHRKPNNTYTVSSKDQYKNEKPIMPNLGKVQNPIDKQMIPHCRNSIKVPYTK
jgi:hypothetical protein